MSNQLLLHLMTKFSHRNTQKFILMFKNNMKLNVCLVEFKLQEPEHINEQPIANSRLFG